MRKLFFVIVFFGFSIPLVCAQDVRHYVVIGSFGTKDNAARLAGLPVSAKLNARYDLNASKKLYYVYLLESTNEAEVYTYVRKVRLETPFKDAWVYHGSLGNRPLVSAPSKPKEEVKQEVKEEVQPVVNMPVTTVAAEPAPPVVQEMKKEEPKELAPPPGKPFLFKLVNEETGSPVEGEIQVLETAKATEYLAYESNQVVYLPAPKNSKGTFQLKTIAPGYKVSKRALNYTDPANSASGQGAKNEYIIAIPLVRVKTGDYIEFTNVRFFPNTTILQPDSRHELDGLAALMKENGKYKIIVHGHCNGTEERDITALGTSADLFATSPSNSREHANAVQFTLLRAETVKTFLIQQGIDASRIKTKGQGGKEFLYPPNSTLSARNDRVEVEVKKK
jgi:outer membrane protein OmpA-like peptidoglycan-associated protein